MAGLTEAVVPTRNGAVVGVSVVPKADLVDVLASCERCSCRNADRRWRPTPGKAGPARRESIEVRCLHDRMAVATQHPAAVLIGHDDEQVLSSRSTLSNWLGES